ncbi:hypothetical protein AvCA_15410 [Azotobacter vinelandii CA]|uniref:Uncharacterized protein n=2 Tax=Azotobacter vinelandii TaxID=354 RepID=C1DRL8_AZOVD|nr:hypothetical protein Avin_15410 [Azotobacter vinelandii DJ]AGK16985.1 hypothetical protein AvCA_15410 [Azotobacter vinelandii CA]AGK19960.1 hypothetical protein AvCA6_15410 [Azotobacter vinelandii CA6]
MEPEIDDFHKDAAAGRHAAVPLQPGPAGPAGRRRRTPGRLRPSDHRAAADPPRGHSLK